MNLGSPQFRHLGGSGQADFIQTVMAMHDQDVAAAELPRRLGERRQPGFAVYPKHLMRGRRRVTEGTHEIEERADSQFLARADGMAHGAVVCRGKEKTDAHGLDTSSHLCRREIEAQPQGLEHVGATATPGYRTIPMLGHPRPGRRCHQGGRGRDVEGIAGITTGAAGIHQMIGVYRYPGHEGTQGTGRPYQLLYPLPLHAQAHQ